jgi:hypothetical protein
METLQKQTVSNQCEAKRPATLLEVHEEQLIVTRNTIQDCEKQIRDFLNEFNISTPVSTQPSDPNGIDSPSQFIRITMLANETREMALDLRSALGNLRDIAQNRG